MRARFGFALVLALGCFTDPPAGTAYAADHVALADGMSADDGPQIADYEPFDMVLPRWSARVGAVILRRSRGEPQTLITTLNGAKLLDASDYRFGFQGGPEVYVIRQGQRADVDFRYFGVGQWISPTQTISNPNGVQFQFADPSQTQVNAPVTVTTNYSSTLQSLESNFRQNVSPRFTLLAGFRYISLRERLAFNLDIANGGLSIDAALRTTNNLYGFQLGADGILWDNGARLRLEGVIKAGIYGNNAQNQFIVRQVEGSQDISNRLNHAAFVGDLNFTGVYQLNQSWAVRAGYQLLWVAGVALASDQMHVIDPNQGAVNQIDVHGTAFYHGALVGLERIW